MAPSRPSAASSSDDDDEEEESNIDRSNSESEGSNDDRDTSDDEEEDDDETSDDEAKAETQKHNLVEQDLIELRKMADDMDKVKMRIQFRLARGRSSEASLLDATPPTSTIANPLRRRSSVEEIFVPASVSAAVQTTWDMPRIFDIERLVTPSDDPECIVEAPPAADVAPAAPQAQRQGSIQLSLQDLARSYGLEKAVASEAPPAFASQMASKVTEPRSPRVDTEPVVHDSPQAQRPQKSGSRIWDGLLMHVNSPSRRGSVPQASSGTFDPESPMASQPPPPTVDSVESTTRPAPRLSLSQFFQPEASDKPTPSLAPNPVFSSPSSPSLRSHHDSIRPSSSGIDVGGPESPKKAQTIAEKEVEAMQNLLFF